MGARLPPGGWEKIGGVDGQEGGHVDPFMGKRRGGWMATWQGPNLNPSPMQGEAGNVIISLLPLQPKPAVPAGAVFRTRRIWTQTQVWNSSALCGEVMLGSDRPVPGSPPLSSPLPSQRFGPT